MAKLVPKYSVVRGDFMLHRVIYASEAVGPTGFSTLTLAHILGAAERNNRRDHVTGGLLIHQGHILQVLEGARVDLDRLLRRLLADPRHTGLRVLVDTPIPARRWDEPMTLCDRPASLLDRTGLDGLAGITPAEAQAMLALKWAA
jgi:hypothetical protein